eukprot:IDg20847t1
MHLRFHIEVNISEVLIFVILHGTIDTLIEIQYTTSCTMIRQLKYLGEECETVL